MGTVTDKVAAWKEQGSILDRVAAWKAQQRPPSPLPDYPVPAGPAAEEQYGEYYSPPGTPWYNRSPAEMSDKLAAWARETMGRLEGFPRQRAPEWTEEPLLPEHIAYEAANPLERAIFTAGNFAGNILGSFGSIPFVAPSWIIGQQAREKGTLPVVGEEAKRMGSSILNLPYQMEYAMMPRELSTPLMPEDTTGLGKEVLAYLGGYGGDIAAQRRDALLEYARTSGGAPAATALMVLGAGKGAMSLGRAAINRLGRGGTTPLIEAPVPEVPVPPPELKFPSPVIEPPNRLPGLPAEAMGRLAVGSPDKPMVSPSFSDPRWTQAKQPGVVEEPTLTPNPQPGKVTTFADPRWINEHVTNVPGKKLLKGLGGGAAAAGTVYVLSQQEAKNRTDAALGIMALLGTGKMKIRNFAKGAVALGSLMKQAVNRVNLPASKEMLSMVSTADEIGHRYVGTWGETFKDMIKGVKDGNKLGEEIQAGQRPDINGLLNEVHRTLRASGSELGYVENYMPRVLKESVRDAIYSDRLQDVIGTFKDIPSDQAMKNVLQNMSAPTVRLVEHLHERGLTRFQAMTYLEQAVSKDMFPKAGFEKARTLDLPPDVYETNALKVIPRYLERAGLRSAQLEVFGKNGEAFDNLLADIQRQNPKEAPTVKMIVDMWSGEYARQHGLSHYGKIAADAAVAAEVGAKIGLGTATIPNITQPLISTIAELGIPNYVKGVVRTMSSSQQARIRRSGAIRDAIYALAGEPPGGLMGKFSKMTTTLGGFQGINRINLYTAASTFEAAVEGWYRTAQKNTRNGLWARDRLADYGFDWQKPPSENALLEKMYRFATDSQLQKNVLRDPIYFNKPIWRPWILFKRFGVRQATYAKDVLMREIKREGISKTEKLRRTAPTLLRMAAGGYLGGEFVIWAINKLKSVATGDPYYRKDEHLTWERLVNNLAAVGTLGILTDLVATDDPRQIANKVQFTIAPVIANDLVEVLKGNPERIVGSLPKWTLKRTRSTDERERAIKIQRGKEKRAILEMYASRDYEKAARRLALWQENYPDFRFEAKDFNSDAVKKFIQSRTED